MFGPGQHLFGVEPAIFKRNFFGAGDLDALPVLDGAHEGRRLVQAVGRAGVEPGVSAPKERDLQIAAREIDLVYVGDFELAARRGADRGGDVEHVITTLSANGTRFEFECYDVGHIYNLAHFLDRGLVKPPVFVQTIFGILGGIGTDPEDMLHMKRTADRLLGNDYVWSILGAGRHQFNLTTMGAIMGGNVRTGMEDNIYLGKGELAKNNGEMVAKVVRILRELSLEPATPDEAREMLALKGQQNVGF